MIAFWPSFIATWSESPASPQAGCPLRDSAHSQRNARLPTFPHVAGRRGWREVAGVRILSIFGTRPEAIKMAPVVEALRQSRSATSIVCVTGQHREMLDQVLQLFGIKADHDLGLMTRDQTLNGLAGRAFPAINAILDEVRPDRVLVHGDTTTAMVACAGGLPPPHPGRACRGRPAHLRPRAALAGGNEPPGRRRGERPAVRPDGGRQGQPAGRAPGRTHRRHRQHGDRRPPGYGGAHRRRRRAARPARQAVRTPRRPIAACCW